MTKLIYCSRTVPEIEKVSPGLSQAPRPHSPLTHLSPWWLPSALSLWEAGEGARTCLDRGLDFSLRPVPRSLVICNR